MSQALLSAPRLDFAAAMPRFDFPPYRSNGNVYGALLNHRDSLAALGAAVHEAPYKSPPLGVVLYVKPRGSFVAPDRPVLCDAAAPVLEAGAVLGLVIGETACAVREEDALAHVAGCVVACDFSVPHESFFRPQTKAKARDASFVFGATVVALGDAGDVDALAVRVFVDGRLAQETTTGERVRAARRLIADVSDFMTLAPGDVLLTGISSGAPHVRAGQRVAVEIEGIGRLETVVASADEQVTTRAALAGSLDLES